MTVAEAPAQTPTPATPLVRLPFPQDDGTLTPYTFSLGYTLMTLVYDTLLARDEQGVPRPWLAESADTSPDGRRITLRLAPGARWQDGTPVTSADVAFTFSFMVERPHPRFTPQLRAVERVDTVNSSTVAIALKNPSPGFADQPLADVPILPAHLWGRLSPGQVAPEGLPVGSGPYRLVTHRPNEKYRFEANAAHFRGSPAVTAIEVPIITSAEETFRAFERRGVDMIPVSLPEDAAERLQGVGARVSKGPSYLGIVLLFNLRRPPFDDVDLRRAVARVIDLRGIARTVGNAEPANRGFLHPESPWSPSEELYTVDEARTRAELAGLGLAPIQVLAPEQDPIKVEAARQVALALRRAGLEAGERPLPQDDLDRALGEGGTVPTFSLAIGTTSPLASYDPGFLGRHYGSGPGDAPFNVTGYRSPSFDSMDRLIASTADPAARRMVVADALRLLADDAPAVPLFFSNGAYVYRPVIYSGWVFVKGTGIFDKRSFVDRPQVAKPVIEQPLVTGSDDRRFPYGLVALVLLALAAGLAIVALLRRQ